MSTYQLERAEFWMWVRSALYALVGIPGLLAIAYLIAPDEFLKVSSKTIASGGALFMLCTVGAVWSWWIARGFERQVAEAESQTGSIAITSAASGERA